MFKTYVDPNDYPKAKREQSKMKREFGVSTSNPVAVDMNYANVPTNTSQSAKGGQANVKNSSEMNIKRFALEE